MAASPKRRLRAVKGPSGLREAFPSARQKKCNGLLPETYAGYDRWAVDYDYAHKLTEEERIWLAAFTEEHYRGWRLKLETQVTPVKNLREANAAHQKRRRVRNTDTLVLPTEAELEAASRGLQEHELRGRNQTEDEMLRWLDRPKRVK